MIWHVFRLIGRILDARYKKTQWLGVCRCNFIKHGFSTWQPSWKLWCRVSFFLIKQAIHAWPVIVFCHIWKYPSLYSFAECMKGIGAIQPGLFWHQRACYCFSSFVVSLPPCSLLCLRLTMTKGTTNMANTMPAVMITVQSMFLHFYVIQSAKACSSYEEQVKKQKRTCQNQRCVWKG